jgi:hypothetical protein
MYVRAFSLMAIAGLSACGDPKPISVERAMAICTEQARSATKPDVKVGVGVGTSGKVSGGIGIELSGDYLRGTDPYEVYETCVVAKSGEKPTEPLKL